MVVELVRVMNRGSIFLPLLVAYLFSCILALQAAELPCFETEKR